MRHLPTDGNTLNFLNFDFMGVTVNIPFRELLTAVKNLTPAQREQLQSALATPEETKSKERLKNLLLSGPGLTDKQLKTIQQTRKEINQWRTKS